MVDRSCDEATINTMTALINAQKGVDHIDVLQTRKFGCRIYVDVEVSADDDLTLLEAHTIAENIHKAIESNFSEVKHCMVHVKSGRRQRLLRHQHRCGSQIFWFAERLCGQRLFERLSELSSY